jgi:hypothetical protein
MTAFTKIQYRPLPQFVFPDDTGTSMKTLGAITWVSAALLCLAGLGAAAPAHAAGTIDCRLHFQLSGWSAFYKRADGSGTIRCYNGQTMQVHIHAQGGGLTFGKTEVDDGEGRFTGVHDIHEVLGDYASAEAHAGAQVSEDTQILTKGNVSLALSGKGKGWNLGIALGAFIIEP